MTTNYQTIKDAINYLPYPSIAIEAKHPDDKATDAPRKFLAYVLGKNHKNQSGDKYAVLAYQYAGHNTSKDNGKKWRCFQVEGLLSVTQIVFELPPPPPIITVPLPLSADELKWQNCVDIPGGRIERQAEYKPKP